MSARPAHVGRRAPTRTAWCFEKPNLAQTGLDLGLEIDVVNDPCTARQGFPNHSWRAFRIRPANPSYAHMVA